ncbi:MAG TPA: UDP-glucose/GDP-mannose dehydrogenase family protein [Acidimicrobiales bacterium]|nr:UDP-glucose/GDP-mannose dehydrogenase family protein [Acidimicrobiales bacterium]
MVVDIAVVGSGYVGTVIAACLAHVGHSVVGLEADPMKVASLRRGRAPLFEQGLDVLLEAGIRAGSLRFTDDAAEAISGARVVFLCVGTPAGDSGRPDLSALEAAARAIASSLRDGQVIVTKSTVPIGTGNWLATVLEDAVAAMRADRPEFSVVSNPEFLREGSAVQDFLHPDRIVIGSDDEHALDLVEAVYEPILSQQFGGANGHAPHLLRTSLASAEMVKYAANAFLATKISFVNEIANLCERVGASVNEVAVGIGLDVRIGPHFLNAGAGWGGSCFGKDLMALMSTAVDLGCDTRLLRATIEANAAQRKIVIEKLQRHLGTLRGRRVALLGLAFKPGTDDVRDAPAIEVIDRLTELGARVHAHDPVVTTLAGSTVRIAATVEDATRDADAIVVMTEWAEYRTLDLHTLRAHMRGDVLVDGRNVFDPHRALEAGFRYESFGRPTSVRTAVSRV